MPAPLHTHTGAHFPLYSPTLSVSHPLSCRFAGIASVSPGPVQINHLTSTLTATESPTFRVSHTALPPWRWLSGFVSLQRFSKKETSKFLSQILDTNNGPVVLSSGWPEACWLLCQGQGPGSLAQIFSSPCPHIPQPTLCFVNLTWANVSNTGYLDHLHLFVFLD